MMEIIKPEEILAELERITQKDLECIYITTNAFDIYLNDASSLKMDTNKGITGIYFNTNVNKDWSMIQKHSTCLLNTMTKTTITTIIELTLKTAK